MRESLPRPGSEFHTPTAGLEKEDSLIIPEPVNTELNPNMPALNAKTNFRYIGDASRLNGIIEMGPMPDQPPTLTIEETLAAMNNSTIVHQFSN